MTDIQKQYINFKWVNVLTYKYIFRNMPYLVADKFGNFFILPHFNNKRTTEFKQLDKSNGYIYYNRVKISLSTLRIRAIKQPGTVDIYQYNIDNVHCFPIVYNCFKL